MAPVDLYGQAFDKGVLPQLQIYVDWADSTGVRESLLSLDWGYSMQTMSQTVVEQQSVSGYLTA